MTSSECLAKAFKVILNASQQASDLVVEAAGGAAKQQLAELDQAFAQAQAKRDFDTMLQLSRELHEVGLWLTTSQRGSHPPMKA